LVAAINTKKNVLLFGDESKIPANGTAAEKEEFKKLEAAAAAKVPPYHTYHHITYIITCHIIPIIAYHNAGHTPVG
jgi:hypothetical protein